MFKLNKSTTIALYAMMDLARAEEDETVSAADIAKRYNVSFHHLSKVLQQLVRSGLVTAIRGAGGGYRIARDPKNVTMLDIVEIFEGPRGHHRNSCLLLVPGELCERAGVCALTGILEELADQVEFTLESVSLQTLVQNERRRAGVAQSPLAAGG